MGLFEVVADTLFENRRCEGAKGFALFDALIEDVAHFGAARIRDDRTVAGCARSKLGTPLKRADGEAVRDSLCRTLRRRTLAVAIIVELQSPLFKRLPDAIPLEARSGIRTRNRFAARLSQHLV